MIEFTINLPSEGHARLLVDELRKSYWIETADQIEAQIQPPVPAEPTEWGSVVRAFVCGSDPELWVRTLHEQYSGWTNGLGSCVTWHRLCEPEVLRVGIGPSPEPEHSVPAEKVRQVLRSSPTGYLSDKETLTAYKDLRKRLAALLPEGAQ